MQSFPRANTGSPGSWRLSGALPLRGSAKPRRLRHRLPQSTGPGQNPPAKASTFLTSPAEAALRPPPQVAPVSGGVVGVNEERIG